MTIYDGRAMELSFWILQAIKTGGAEGLGTRLGS